MVTQDIDAAPYRIAFMLIPRFNMMALAATLEPMRVANYITGRKLYDWQFLSDDGANTIASNGMPLATSDYKNADEKLRAIFVCGSWGSEHYDDPELFAWLRRMDRFGIHLGAMDIGTYILARARLLSGYRAAILWYCIQAFQEAYPRTLAEEKLFVVDRNRTTIAGGAAGLDMMLDDINHRFGPQLAQEVAEHILHFPSRGSETPQRIAPAGTPMASYPLVRKAVSIMESQIEDPLSIPQIAAKLGVSQRKLERAFKRDMDCSVVRFYRVLRLQFARVLLTNTDLAIREISIACGYSSLSHFAKSFSQQFGKRPRDHREAWPHSEAMPVWPGMTASLTRFANEAQELKRRKM
jgi:transcriptional regulator GlxA family with amidase domain